MYAVIHYRLEVPHVIYGVGNTKQNALFDAQPYIDAELCLFKDIESVALEDRENYAFVYDSESDNFKHSDGMFLLLRCSDKLASTFQKDGAGDIPFEINGNYAYLPDEE